VIELILGVVILSIFLSTTRLLYFIQLKEYRADRFIDFLRYDKGKRQLIEPFSFTIYLGYILILLLSLAEITLLGLALVTLASNLLRVWKYGLYRFKPTKKAVLIYAIFLAILTLYLSFGITLQSISIIYLASPIILISVVLIFVPITKAAKELYIYRAKRKIESFKNLTVIGITGSYGKSSTKEFLYQLLSQKYKVLKTPANINTDIGVAGIILNNLQSDHDVFIIEMGAYRIGEIANICKMKSPDIGILTAVAKQHLSLFGSLDNIKKAKSELLLAVKEGGLRLVNGDNSNSDGLAHSLNLETKTYGMKNNKVDYRIKDVEDTDEILKFEVSGIKVGVKVLGVHQALNVSAAMLAAKEVGMTNAEIETASKAISSPEAVLSLQSGYRGSIILNDSYNSNPDGFIAAINVAKKQKVQGRKVLVTMGMLELGKESDDLHYEVAKHTKGVFDSVIITRKEAYAPFAKLIPTNKIKLIEDHEVLFKYLKKNVEKYDLILIENRLYKYILDFLLDK
jgi:UDP-N-acetylmuramoyl-tripeptide--D-alanyl-D-alanine ligase